jgi:F1-F0 ATPase (N-ATPase) AtpR subunit
MDEERMSFLSFDGSLFGAMPIIIATHLIGGGVVGMLYFRGLWWNANLLSQGGRTTAAIMLLAWRFAFLGGVLTLASLEGALPLLVTALGVLVGRSAVMRSVRKVAP